MSRPRLGVALGSGAARGWAHIGVLRALADLGLAPDVISGASIGALVGAAAAAGQLDPLEDWVLRLSRTDVLMLLDARFRGGVIRGNRVMQAIEELISDRPIEELPMRYGAVATEMTTGREIWLREGSLIDAVRASCALPGLFSARPHGDRWLLDGGLVNPVPVSLCYALGAEVVLAVSFIPQPTLSVSTKPRDTKDISNGERSALERLRELINGWLPTEDEPGMLDVMTDALNIMQERIKRSRLAGEPPDLEIRLKLDLGLMDFHCADVAIPAGREAVEAMRQPLLAVCGKT